MAQRATCCAAWVVETPVRLSDKQKDLLREFNESLESSGTKHTPKATNWFQSVRSFFRGLGMTIAVAVAGAGGRMGRMLVSGVVAADDLNLGAAFGRPRLIGHRHGRGRVWPASAMPV